MVKSGYTAFFGGHGWKPWGFSSIWRQIPPNQANYCLPNQMLGSLPTYKLISPFEEGGGLGGGVSSCRELLKRHTTPHPSQKKRVVEAVAAVLGSVRPLNGYRLLTAPKDNQLCAIVSSSAFQPLCDFLLLTVWQCEKRSNCLNHGEAVWVRRSVLFVKSSDWMRRPSNCCLKWRALPFKPHISWCENYQQLCWHQSWVLKCLPL